MTDKRDYGTGHLYIDPKRDAYYGRWRTGAGRLLHRKVGPVRHRGESDGLTRAEAEKKFRIDNGIRALKDKHALSPGLSFTTRGTAGRLGAASTSTAH
jgi:hypothetical protein